MSDDYKLYTFNESKKKLNEISYILSKKLGDRWKAILFLTMLLMIAVIVLIITGINIPDYEVPVGHVKVFFIVSLLSIAFFCAWACLIPYTDTKVRGIVPFPPGTEYIPVDSTQCGISPTLCAGAECDTLCKNKDGKNKYGCKKINSENVYYLGTRLEKGKSYCLPNIKQLNDIEGCGTYTGRIVWAQGNDGTLRWECQCLYPDLYSGSQCLTQVACTDNNPDPFLNKGVLGKLVDQKDGKTEWDPANMTASLQNVNPYEKMPDGTPRFQCSCDKDPANKNVFYSTANDPFVCTKNLCLYGMGSSTDALFDKKTNKCMCNFDPKKGGTTVRSNVSGFCYPYDQDCNPNPITGMCKYGADIYDVGKRILFKNGNDYYLSDIVGGAEQLINITDIVNNTANNIDKNNIFDLSGTIMKNAFYSFPVVNPSDFSDKTNGVLTTIKAVMAEAGKDAMLVRLNNIAKAASKNGGIAQLCNSFFYRRDAPNCNYQLNKEGSESIFNKDLITIDCGKDANGNNAGTAVADITNSKGYTCLCNDQNAKLVNGYCVNCVEDNKKTTVVAGVSSCCSGKGYVWDAGKTQILCGHDEPACFSGDSIVTMGDGSFKRISEVKVGDRVMSGKSKESVNVIALFTELFEKEKLFGMNGVAPFATTDHCFLTPSHKFSCINTEFVIQKEHKNEKDVVQLEEGTELLMKHLPVVVHNITYQDMDMFNVYNILTEDGSYVVNDFSVSDGFPDIYSHPIVAQGIITILLSLGEELETYDRKNKKTSELFNRYKHNISFDTDVSPSVENAVSTFFELTQKHENYIKIAYDLWRESFHDFYKLANSI